METISRINLYCVLVLYNSEVEDSVACSRIKDINNDNCHIIIVDNSTRDFGNRESCERYNWKYIGMNGNVGLSKAYNKAVAYISTVSNNENDLIVLLNDDTDVTEEFLNVLTDYGAKYLDVDIFAPIMQGQNGIYYSPARAGFFKNHYIRTPEETIPQNKFFAIASCSAIRLHNFNKYRFDEEIFMDLIDNNFCDDQRYLGRKFMKINLIIQQNYALKNPNLTFERCQNRYKIWIPDFLVYCKKKKMRMIGYLPAVAARGVMLSLKCKNAYFWFWAMGYSIRCLCRKA